MLVACELPQQKVSWPPLVVPIVDNVLPGGIIALLDPLPVGLSIINVGLPARHFGEPCSCQHQVIQVAGGCKQLRQHTA